jgi:hypothetical protein
MHDLVAELRYPACLVVRRAISLHANQAGRQRDDKLHHLKGRSCFLTTTFSAASHSPLTPAETVSAGVKDRSSSAFS